MRAVAELGLAPLADDGIAAMLGRHIPYRIQLLRNGLKPGGAECWQDNQAFEAGAMAGRMLLSFLGIRYDEKADNLKEDREHWGNRKDGTTDEVKIRDVGGQFVELDDMSPADRDALAKFIRGVHKACAHFTLAEHELSDPKTYEAAVPIILRLLDACLPRPHAP